jgi:hypothetical protein
MAARATDPALVAIAAPVKHAARMTDLETLLEKDRIVDTLVELFVATDRREWNSVREVFAPNVHFDMSSLTGVPASAMTGAQIAQAWDEGLEPLKAIHHQAGNFQVRVQGPTTAGARCYAIATHFLPNPAGRNTRTFVGSYDFELEKLAGRWRIALFRFNLKYVEGNLELERSAPRG